MTKDEQTIEKVYGETRRMVGSIVRKIKRTYGGNYAELMVDSDIYWMHAWNTYDQTKQVDFKTWMYWQVWGRLKREIEVNHRNHKFQAERLFGNEIAKSHFDLEELLQQLSPRAKQVVLLVLDMPLCVIPVKGKPGTNRWMVAKRLAIRRYLVESGWPHQQINSAFKEIQEALLD